MDDASLGFLLAHPAALGIAFQRPLALLLLAGTALLFRVSPFARHITALRVLAYTAIVLGLAGIRLTASLPAQQLVVIAAVDTSDSIADAGLDWSRRYLSSLRASLAPGDQLLVTTFAESARLIAAGEGDSTTVDVERGPDTMGTDLTAAIDQAMTLFPPDAQKVLVLLTDGNETRGDSRSRLPSLAALGIRLDAATPPRQQAPNVRITRLSAPAVSSPERPLPVRVAIRNSGSARSAVLKLHLDHRIADSAAVELAPGLNLFEFLVQIDGAGSHVLRCDLVAELPDPRPTSWRETTVAVRPSTRVLLATSRRFSPIAQALAARGVAVSSVSPRRLPADSDAYSTTHLVVLEDLSGGDLDARQIAALEHFVRERGGGLLFAGGTRTYGDQAFQKTQLGRVLPVTLEPARPKPGQRDPLALFLVIDRSNSMGFNSRIGTLRDGEKMRYAIKAGVAVVEQLKDDDRVGVIAFDARPHEIAPLQPLSVNRSRLLDALPRIVESGGTDFYDALVTAGEQLARSRVGRKHIVLLTDGDTNRADRGEYRELVRDLAAKGVSVTTIRIGDNQVNLKLLKDISEGTGGSFHYVEDARQLPELMLRDTSRVLQPPAPETDRFFPVIGLHHQLLSGTNEKEIPHLRDYAFSRAKPSSETLLQVARADRMDPLLSVWRYGLGRVAAFTASPGDDAESWPAWNGFARFWSQLAFWAARPESEEDIFIAAVRRREATELTARTGPQSAPETALAGTLHAGERRYELRFAAQGNSEHIAIIPPLPPGRYPVALRFRTGGQWREMETAVSLPAHLRDEAQEFDHDGDNAELLRHLTRQTGGTMDATARDVTRRPSGTRRVAYPLSGIMAALAIAAFFADVALRRIAAMRRSGGEPVY